MLLDLGEAIINIEPLIADHGILRKILDLFNNAAFLIVFLEVAGNRMILGQLTRLAFICMLVYSSFIRPAEICRIKIKDIHLDKSAIFIPGENAKNTHARWATLTHT